VRVNPDELHIQDSEFYDQLYSRAARRDKYAFEEGRFGNNLSVFTTADHHHHSLRRSVLNPMFSKRSLLAFQPVVRNKLEILCDKIAQCAEGNGDKVLNLSYAWSAWTGDLICEYSFGFCYNHLESPDFKVSFHEPFIATTGMGHFAVQFPWLHPVSA
jgi:cytochrome P450